MRKVFCTLLATLLLSANLFSSCPSCGRSAVYYDSEHFEVVLPDGWQQVLLHSSSDLLGCVLEAWVYPSMLPEEELIFHAYSEELDPDEEAEEKTTITTLIRDFLDLDFYEETDGESPFYSHWEILEESESEAIVKAYMMPSDDVREESDEFDDEDEHDWDFTVVRMVLTPSTQHSVAFIYAGDNLPSEDEQAEMVAFLKQVPIVSP